MRLGHERQSDAQFHARGEAAWQQYLRSGESLPAEQVFERIQLRFDERRKQLLRDTSAPEGRDQEQ